MRLYTLEEIKEAYMAHDEPCLALWEIFLEKLEPKPKVTNVIEKSREDHFDRLKKSLEEAIEAVDNWNPKIKPFTGTDL